MGQRSNPPVAATSVSLSVFDRQDPKRKSYLRLINVVLANQKLVPSVSTMTEDVRLLHTAEPFRPISRLFRTFPT